MAINERIYFTELASRLLNLINLKLGQDKTHKKRTWTRRKLKEGERRPFSIQQLSRDTGIGYFTLYAYIVRRNTIPIDALDKILWAMNLTVLDLFYMPERDAIAKGLSTIPEDMRRLPWNDRRNALRRLKREAAGAAAGAASEVPAVPQESVPSDPESTQEPQNSIDIGPDAA